MRVLFYNHTGNVSGAERVLLLTLERMDRSVIDPFVVCPEGELSIECEKLGVPVRAIPELNARFTLRPDRLAVYFFSLVRTVWALREEIVRARVDVIHANSIRAGIATLFATLGMPCVVFWHVHDELRPHPFSSAIRLFVRVSKRCRVIAVSAATASTFAGRVLKRSWVTERMVVIHNAVDIAKLDKDDKRPELRREMGLEDNSFLFGIVGQITPRKGQLELVKAFAKASEQMPLARLLIVGRPIFNNDNAYHTRVTAEVGAAGLTDKVMFLGHRSDAVRIIRELDALVINSSSEAFVMVAIEAMACRTPVIATDVGGTREMIRDGYNGWLITHGDEEQLTDVLRTTYLDKHACELFAKRSRRIAETQLDAPRFIHQLQSALLTARKELVPGREFDGSALNARACENR